MRVNKETCKTLIKLLLAVVGAVAGVLGVSACR